MASTVKIELDVLLPTIPSEEDQCVERLRNLAEGNRGVEKAHIDHINGKAVICIHYNDDFLTLSQVERLMRQSGAKLSRRFQHESLYIRGMNCSDCANNVESVTRRVPGVLDVAVNYSAEKMRIEYDSEAVKRQQILGKVKALGYRVEEQEPEESFLQKNKLLLISVAAGLGFADRLFVGELGFSGCSGLHWHLPAGLSARRLRCHAAGHKSRDELATRY